MLGRKAVNGSSEMVSQLAAALTTLLLNTILFRLHQEAGVAAGTIIVFTQFLLTSHASAFPWGCAIDQLSIWEEGYNAFIAAFT